MAESETSETFIVDGACEGLRLDQCIAAKGSISRSQIAARVSSTKINGKEAKLSTRVVEGDSVEYRTTNPPPSELVPENINLNIVFENSDVIVIDKPCGLVVHPAAGNWSGTLVHGLLHHIEELEAEDFPDTVRPGIVHRLDKDTSGVLIVAKNVQAQAFLAEQFQKRETKKTYLALGMGRLDRSSVEVEDFIVRDPKARQRFTSHPTSGKHAKTQFIKRGETKGAVLLEVHPLTGRTHQIRVHAKKIGLPLFGDVIYAAKSGNAETGRLMLHAWRLELTLPGEERPVEFTAQPPHEFLEFCARRGLGAEIGKLVQSGY